MCFLNHFSLTWSEFNFSFGQMGDTVKVNAVFLLCYVYFVILYYFVSVSGIFSQITEFNMIHIL